MQKIIEYVPLSRLYIQGQQTSRNVLFPAEVISVHQTVEKRNIQNIATDQPTQPVCNINVLYAIINAVSVELHAFPKIT